jgi:hypothetical protein
MGDREKLLRLTYIKLMDAVELLQSIGEDLLADEVETVAAKVGRAALRHGPRNRQGARDGRAKSLRSARVCGVLPISSAS